MRRIVGELSPYGKSVEAVHFIRQLCRSPMRRCAVVYGPSAAFAPLAGARSGSAAFARHERFPAAGPVKKGSCASVPARRSAGSSAGGFASGGLPPRHHTGGRYLRQGHRVLGLRGRRGAMECGGFDAALAVDEPTAARPRLLGIHPKRRRCRRTPYGADWRNIAENGGSRVRPACRIGPGRTPGSKGPATAARGV